MKVTLRAKARFYFTVDRTTVEQLIEIAKCHYDLECQRAAARVGEPIRPGATFPPKRSGILVVWRDGLWNSDTYESMAGWRDLDLIAKICEQAAPEQTKAIEFGLQIKRMFEFAGPKITNEWKEDFNV